ncbi:MAG TPA: DUF1622 domain-containing protein [Acidobacteriaceae bacterium]|nr:DUF1622 domain-containing protein [Acidobacteriaceae bacterium]
MIMLGGVWIELIAAVVISYHALWGLLCIIRRRGSDQARLILAKGVLDGLGFMAAGTLLMTLALQNWTEIRTFAVVLSLRTLLKRVFQFESQAIEGRLKPKVRESPQTQQLNQLN